MTNAFIVKRKTASVLFFLLFLPVWAFSQNAGLNITGKVTDTKGEPLVGVTVIVQNENRGSVSDNDGRYSIARDVTRPNTTLSFSMLGFKTLTVEVPAVQDVLDVEMEEDVNLLDEAVAIGYGTQTKRTMTAAGPCARSQDNDVGCHTGRRPEHRGARCRLRDFGDGTPVHRGRNPYGRRALDPESG